MSTLGASFASLQTEKHVGEVSARLGGGDSHIIIDSEIRCSVIDADDLDKMTQEVIALDSNGGSVSNFIEAVTFVAGYFDPGMATVSYAFALKKSNRTTYKANYLKFYYDTNRWIQLNDTAHIYQKFVRYEDTGWEVQSVPVLTTKWCPACGH